MDCAYNLVLAGFRRQDVGDIPAWRAALDRYYTMVAVKAEKTQIALFTRFSPDNSQSFRFGSRAIIFLQSTRIYLIPNF